jgi:fructose-1-phosphate kinase PfkB-like protein
MLIVGQNTAWQKLCVLARLIRGEVNRVEEMIAFPSSKGPNVARALSIIGEDGLVLGYTGGWTGKLFSEGLRKEGIRGDFTNIEAETRICTTFSERNGPITEVIEPSPEITPKESELFRASFMRHIGGARLLFISGTAVLGESEDCYSVMVAEARRRGIPVILDSACPQARLALAQTPEVLKVNLQELGQIVGGSVEELSLRVKAYKRLSSDFGIRWFFTTHGAEGMEAFNGISLLHASPPKVRTVNAIGSGDVAAAGIGWVLLREITARGREAVFSSRAALENALVTSTAMGTANCLDPVNGHFRYADFLSLKEKTTLREMTRPD